MSHNPATLYGNKFYWINGSALFTIIFFGIVLNRLLDYFFHSYAAFTLTIVIVAVVMMITSWKQGKRARVLRKFENTSAFTQKPLSNDTCPSCMKPLGGGSNFCYNCGFDLTKLR